MRRLPFRYVPLSLATLAIGAIGPGGNSSAVPKKAAAARSPWKTIRVGGFNLKLDPVSQTARGLSPATGADFIACSQIQVVYGGVNLTTPTACAQTRFG